MTPHQEHGEFVDEEPLEDDEPDETCGPCPYCDRAYGSGHEDDCEYMR